MDIYTPLANRLGIFQFKWELEDLCLRTLEPAKYFRLVDEIASTRAARQAYIEEVIDILREKLHEAGIQGEIYGRPKNLYSIYSKMIRQNKELSEIYDILAVRVIVKDIADCYGVLGLVHSMWTPMPGRFKDYIALPKQNMYQSIHTTIISPNGKPLEIQIRTEEMHQVAEHGIAAHWQYKEGVSAPAKTAEKLNWLRQMLDWQKEVRDADEFMESVKNELFDEVRLCIYPQGRCFLSFRRVLFLWILLIVSIRRLVIMQSALRSMGASRPMIPNWKTAISWRLLLQGRKAQSRLASICKTPQAKTVFAAGFERNSGRN